MLKKLQSIKSKQEEGFTLIELLVVILIIGILSAIAIPAFMNQRKSAVDSSLESDVASIAKAIETEAVKNPDASVENQVISHEGVSQLAFISASKLMITDQTPKVSNGNLVHVYGTEKAGEYCVIGVNLGGDRAKDGIFYDSTAGGMNNSGGACADTDSDGAVDKVASVVAAAEAGKSGSGSVEEAPSALAPFHKTGNATITTNGVVENITYTVDAKVTRLDNYENPTWSYTMKFSKPINSHNPGIDFTMTFIDQGMDSETNSNGTSAITDGVMTGTIFNYKNTKVTNGFVVPTHPVGYALNGDWSTLLNFTS